MPKTITTIRTTRACLATPYLVTLGILRLSRSALHVLRVLLVFLADVFHQLFMRPEASGEGQGERLGIIAGMDDRDFILESSQILARVTLDGVQLLGMRMATEIEPELVIEPD